MHLFSFLEKLKKRLETAPRFTRLVEDREPRSGLPFFLKTNILTREDILISCKRNPRRLWYLIEERKLGIEFAYHILTYLECNMDSEDFIELLSLLDGKYSNDEQMGILRFISKYPQYENRGAVELAEQSTNP